MVYIAVLQWLSLCHEALRLTVCDRSHLKLNLSCGLMSSQDVSQEMQLWGRKVHEPHFYWSMVSLESL
jgi:hypothetical protein